MIKILKKGSDVFFATCPKCYTEISYELEDINAGGTVLCPHCSEHIAHKYKFPDIPDVTSSSEYTLNYGFDVVNPCNSFNEDK